MNCFSNLCIIYTEFVGSHSKTGSFYLRSSSSQFDAKDGPETFEPVTFCGGAWLDLRIFSPISFNFLFGCQICNVVVFQVKLILGISFTETMHTFLLELHEIRQQWAAEEVLRDVRRVGLLSATLNHCQRTDSPAVLRLRELVVRLGQHLTISFSDFEHYIECCTLEDLDQFVLKYGMPKVDMGLLYWTRFQIRKLLGKMKSGCPCQFCSPFVFLLKKK